MFHAQGIVLKKTPYREFDEILTVFTKNFGKIEILGRGVKRPLAKLNSHLQIFDLSEVEFVLGKKFKVLTGANLISNFIAEQDGTSIKIITDFFGLIDELVGVDDPDKNIWELILEFKEFTKKDKTKDENKKNLFYNFFKFRLISLCGFEPMLDRCASCSKKIKEEKIFFSPKDGGLVCSDCGASDKNIFPILPSTVKLFRIFSNNNRELLSKIKISKKELDDLAGTMDYFVKWNITA